MRTVTDNAGRTFTVSVNTTTAKSVRTTVFEGGARVDLLDVIGGGLIERLIRDPVLLVDVLYVVCKADADRLGVSAEEFGRAMAGDVIEHATTALLEETVDFCPNHRERSAMRLVLKAIQRTQELARDRVETGLEARLEAASRQALATAGASFGSAQESQASTPAP